MEVKKASSSGTEEMMAGSDAEVIMLSCWSWRRRKG